MKSLKTSFASRVRLFRGALVAILLAGLVVQSEAQIYTISFTVNGINYGAAYDTSQNGFTSWSANGQNQLALQTLYYSITGGSVMQLPTPTSVVPSYSKNPVTHVTNSATITADYSIPGYGTVVDALTLSGSPLTETIQFNNTSGNTVTISIF